MVSYNLNHLNPIYYHRTSKVFTQFKNKLYIIVQKLIIKILNILCNRKSTNKLNV